jgi:anti-sigma B factor antagonist
MEIVKTLADNRVNLAIKGKLSALEATDFGMAVETALKESSSIRMDFADVSYLASAGLRVVVSAQKKTESAGGGLVLANVDEDIMEVFEITGLDDVLTFE